MKKGRNFNACGDPEVSLRKATTLTTAERFNAIHQIRTITGGIRLPSIVLFGETIPGGDFTARPYK